MVFLHNGHAAIFSSNVRLLNLDSMVILCIYVVDYIYHSPMCVGIILSDGLFNYHCFALSLLFDSSSSTFFMSTDAAVYSVVRYILFHIVSITHCLYTLNHLHCWQLFHGSCQWQVSVLSAHTKQHLQLRSVCCP